jgi:hypothetical protein
MAINAILSDFRSHLFSPCRSFQHDGKSDTLPNMTPPDARAHVPDDRWSMSCSEKIHSSGFLNAFEAVTLPILVIDRFPNTKDEF